MYFMKNLRKNQKRKGSTHDYSWGAPIAVELHSRLPMHHACPDVLRRVPRAGHHPDEDEQHGGGHEDVERTRVPVRVDERADRLVADLPQKHRAPVENDRQETVESPRPENGQRPRQHSTIALAEGGAPVEVNRSGMTGFDDACEGRRHEPDEQERRSHEGHHHEALRIPSRQKAVWNCQQNTRQYIEDTEYDLHTLPRFLWLGMCGFDQATMTRLLCRYNSITDVCRQGQQKIRTFAVSSFLNSWIKNFSSPKIKIWFEPMFFKSYHTFPTWCAPWDSDPEPCP